MHLGAVCCEVKVGIWSPKTKGLVGGVDLLQMQQSLLSCIVRVPRLPVNDHTKSSAEHRSRPW